MIRVETENDREGWDANILSYGGHPLQLWGWGEVKKAHGWNVERLVVFDDTTPIGYAQLLVKQLPKPFNCLVYVPRGPVADETNRAVVMDAISDFAKRTNHAVTISIEPDWPKMPSVKGWKKSSNRILLATTLVLDLTKTEDELMEAIPRKRRYDIRKSLKDNTDIHEIATEQELADCLELYKFTAKRAGFDLHGDDYYKDIFTMLGEKSRLIAVFNEAKKPIAFTWLAVTDRIAFELYGGINDEGQSRRANFALKWWCIAKMQQEGIKQYDFNGLLNDGISNFKRNFADHEDEFVGTYNKPLSPLYSVWERALPAAKKVLRLFR